MKVRQLVTYCNGDSCQPATIAALVGAGPSLYKRLDLVLSPALTVFDVPHEKDASDGDDFWVLHDPARHTASAPLVGRKGKEPKEKKES